MDTRPRVLIVDRQDETRSVLREVFQRRGIDLLEASGAREGVALAHDQKPDVVVLDIELARSDDEGAAPRFGHDTGQPAPRMLLLGSVERSGAVYPGQPCMAKPYHYAPLIRRIEELLGSVR